MAKIIRAYATILVLGMALLACSSGQDGNQTDAGDPIAVESPMTVSDNDLKHVNGKPQYLRLKLVRGKYYEDWNPGPIHGTVWEGDYVIELADEHGNVKAQTDLSRYYPQPLIFMSHFQLEFDDYNDDGDTDFTIGQYASGNGWDYRLFTLRENGVVDELPIRDHSALFISMHSKHSLKLEKIDSTSFKCVHYENSRQAWVERVFRWDGEAFVQAESREVDMPSSGGD